MVWQGDGKNFAFLQQDDTSGSTVFFYSGSEEKLQRFSPEQYNDFPGQYHIENGYANGLTIAADGSKVFFTIRKDADAAEKFDGVQQWNGNDAVLYSERMHFADIESNTRVVAWWPQENKFRCVTDNDKPFCLLNATKDYALLYNENELKPQYKLVRDVNFYVTDLKTGIRKLLLENQAAELSKSSFSPGGKYFVYLKGHDWWLYDFRNERHLNLTENSGLQVTNEEDKSWKEIYQIAGWGPKDDYLLIYDQFDLWKIDFDGTFKRLTNGRESGVSYRIVAPRESEFYRSDFRGHVDLPVDTNADIILSARKGNDTGYFVLNANGKIQVIAFDSLLSKDLLKAGKANTYSFLSQNYNKPPVLRMVRAIGLKPNDLFASNPQHKKFLWGKQEIIDYENSQHIPLKGILYYPADFDASKKYPMVVHIYEKQSYMEHYYTNPSHFNMSGFNVANLTAKGYFVLLPDIEYNLGGPGVSATDCVVAATNAVLAKGYILKDKVGLIGHSFGVMRPILLSPKLTCSRVRSRVLLSPICLHGTFQ